MNSPSASIITMQRLNNDATLAKASFPLTVEEEAISASGSSGFYRGTLISGLVGLVIGFGFALTPFIRKR